MLLERFVTDRLWKPQVGKYGLARNGEKIGPMVFNPEDRETPWSGDAHGVVLDFHADGRRWIPADDAEHDLVEEWIEDPGQAGKERPIRPAEAAEVRASFTEAEPVAIPKPDPVPSMTAIPLERHGIRIEIVGSGEASFTLTREDAISLGRWLLDWAERSA